MTLINRDKYNDCLEKYIFHCENSDWVDAELYKFRFANWLNRKVNLKLQPVKKIQELGLQSMKERFDYDSERGVQFIIRGALDLSKAITLNDAEIFKSLSEKDDPTLVGTYKRGTSFPIISAWLGTLLPKKYVSVVTTDFTHPIKLLFNVSIARKGINFFTQSQEYYKVVKDELKASGLKPYFLPEINKYLKGIYPNSEAKKKYDECDWNWVTEDFALYIFREYLDLYEPKVKKPKTPTNKSKALTTASEDIVEQDYKISQDTPEESFEPKPPEPEVNMDTANNEKVDNLLDLIEIDYKYRNATPEVKEFISKRIERGSFAKTFKQVAGHKCMICDRMGLPPLSFRKPDGDNYVEVHHVIHVSELVSGSLSSTNLITVCANHHRQLHYGNCQVVEIDDKKFLFRIDNKLWNIQKLSSILINK